MERYELHARRNGEWVFDGFVDSKEGAMDEARTLVERDSRVSAVRVIKLEDRGNEVTERPICTVLPERSRKEPPAEPPRRPKAPQAPRTAAARARGTPIKRAPLTRSWSSRERGLGIAVVVIALGIVVYGIIQPKQPWAFDLPDAQKPHMIRNQFTGEYTR